MSGGGWRRLWRFGPAMTVLILLASVVIAEPASAARTVDCTSDPSALQPAIDRANPDVTLLITGTCIGHFTVSKDLILSGEGGTLDTPPCQSGTPLEAETLRIDSGNVRVKNLTITSEIPPDGFDCSTAPAILNHGSLTLKNSTVSRGSNDGIENFGSLTVIRSTISRNGSPWGSGGITNRGGTVFVSRSTIGGNEGGGINNGGTVTVERSTIAGNLSCSGCNGGGIVNGGTLFVSNSTIYGNGTNDGFGGGIANYGTATIVESTIAGNGTDEGGAGIWNAGTVTITATILWNPKFNAFVNRTISDDCWGDLGVPPLNSGGYNVIGNVDGFYPLSNHCPFVAQPTDLVGHAFGSGQIDSLLGAFGPHGGPTYTLPLLRPRSPALDRIPVGSVGADGTPLCPTSGSVDQRGFPRPGGPACDAGAYEVQITS
jgi:hypothetical protein